MEKQSFKDYEIIVTDNASSDTSLFEIQKFLKKCNMGPLLKLILLSSNLGFASGNLEGLKRACGEYIAHLNNNADPDERWLGELVMSMDNDPTIINL